MSGGLDPASGRDGASIQGSFSGAISSMASRGPERLRRRELPPRISDAVRSNKPGAKPR